MEKKAYFDHSATTYVKKTVLDKMLPYFSIEYGNVSGVYSVSRQSKKAVEEARVKVAQAIGAQPKEVFFTGSGTESDNWAIKGVLRANQEKGKHMITTRIEHAAILEACAYMEKQGFEVTYLPVDEFGRVSLDELEKAIRPTTVLISVMFANNEMGTIQPIQAIGKLAKEKGILFHTDAVQGVGTLEINVLEQNIDLLSMSAHKFYGPKGVGALYVKKGIKIEKYLHGGHQERGTRGSTENVPGIVGMGEAIAIAVEQLPTYVEHLSHLRERLIQQLIEQIPDIRLNGHPVERLPGNVNISIKGVKGESVLFMLDRKGICASSGSACTSGSLDPSHVLIAMGLSHDMAQSAIRFTLGEQNTQDDINYLLEVLPPIVKRLRQLGEDVRLESE